MRAIMVVKWRAQALDLAISLLAGLGTTEVDALFEFLIRPALKHADGFTERTTKDLLDLMFAVMHSCHFSAKRHRLYCLYFLIAHVSKDGYEKLKCEANKKTRNRSYEISVQIGHACVDQENSGTRRACTTFSTRWLAVSLAETPHMISAAVKGMTSLT
uniref:Uncharacterized protein n=1 Tax=Tanacetum cinerariifolium TaxID=118510 RepID=A0A699HV86_TANCI|nr:hypothetical protein [Tanacetum cinerariifolium]